MNKHGHRMASGGKDSEILLWDFPTMSAELNSFRSFCPVETHMVYNIEISKHEKEFLLCITGTIQPLIYTKDGRP